VKVLGIQELTPEWHEARRTAISGTDVAAILGVHPWKSELEVWARITGRVQETREETEPMFWGTRLEPIVRDVWAERTGLTWREAPGLVAHSEVPWLLGTPDGFVDPRVEFALDDVYEGKTGSAWKLSDWEDGMPVAYALQGQTYLAITGGAILHYACLLGGQTLLIGELPADEDLHALMLERLESWWVRHVDGGVAPDPTARPQDGQILRRLHPNDSGATVVLPSSADEDLASYLDLGEELRTMKERRQLAAHRIQAALGDATYGIADGFRASWKSDKNGKRCLRVASADPTNP